MICLPRCTVLSRTNLGRGCCVQRVHFVLTRQPIIDNRYFFEDCPVSGHRFLLFLELCPNCTKFYRACLSLVFLYLLESCFHLWCCRRFQNHSKPLWIFTNWRLWFLGRNSRLSSRFYLCQFRSEPKLPHTSRVKDYTVLKTDNTMLNSSNLGLTFVLLWLRH